MLTGPTVDADELLARLEPLPHDARIREVVAHGRAARADAGRAAALAELERRGFAERYLSLAACYGSRDGTHVLRALGDPSRAIRQLAVRLVVLACDDEEARRALGSLRPADRRALARRLRRRRRLAPIDRTLEGLALADDRALADLLPYGSARSVTLHLPRVEAGTDPDFWARLARQHPDLAASALLARAARMEDGDPRPILLANAALPALAKARPEAAAALVEALAAHVAPHRLALGPVLARRPAAIVDLVLRSDDRVRLALDPIVARLDLPRLVALLGRLPEAHAAVQYRFRALPAEARSRLFAAFGAGWRDGDGAVEVSILRGLPGAQRLAEARRTLSLPALATRPLQRLPYAGLLPWDEAMALLAPHLGSPDPDLRIAAHPALATAVRYERGRAGELLALIRGRRNEQDPVRLAMLTGLADLPPGTWRAGHLADLGAVIREALDAADLSEATAAAAGRLVAALLPFHPAWAVEWLVALVRERGSLAVADLEARLGDADMDRIAPILLPVLESWAVREREPQLLGLAAGLGRRLRRFDALGAILARLCATTRTAWHADRALRLLQRHQPARFAALVPALLAADRSVATLAPVWGHLHRRRQDLLTPYLGQHAYAGRFATGNTLIVLPFDGGYARWTQAQRDIFADTLRAITRRNPTLGETPTIQRGIAQLAALQGVPAGQLIRLARRGDQAVRDAALRALGRLDDTTEALPALLEAMGDDRARIAIYALRRALLEMPASRAIATLRAVPLERVTVAKEVVRLYGELPDAEAFAALEDLAARTLHRDVRAALLRALWGHLDRAEAWQLLEAAATSPDPALARGTMRIPADRLSPDGQRRLVALLGTLLGHPEPTVRVAVAERCAGLPVADPERLLLTRLLGRLTSPLPDERRAAAGAVFATCEARDAARIGASTAALLPDRRALLTAIDALLAALPWSRERLLPACRAALLALGTDRLTAALQARLAIAALPWEEVGTLLLRLAERGDLQADALASACAALVSASRRPDLEGLELLERRLAASADRDVRRLGLAAMAGLSSPPRGWDAARLARLRAYREDASPPVAAAAQFTLPAEELERDAPEPGAPEDP